MSLLKRWQESNWYSTLGAKVAVALLATAVAVLLTTDLSWAQTATFTPTPTRTPTPTNTPNVGATQTALATNPPAISGTPGPAGACAPAGVTCTIGGGTGVTGTYLRITSGNFNITSTVPALTTAGTAPVLFLQTTAGTERFTQCTAVTAPGSSVTCQGDTAGDLLLGSIVTVRFAAGGTIIDVTGVVSGPGLPTSTPTRTATATATSTITPTVNATQTAAALLTQVRTSAQPPISGTATPPVPCATLVGQGCTISSVSPGGPTGTAGKVSSFTFNVTTTAPAGSVANQNPIIFISTTIGIETQVNNATFTCSAVTAGAQTVCQGRTNGDILQGGEVRVRFVTPGVTVACVGSAVATPANFTDLCGNAFGPGLAGGVPGAVVPIAPPIGAGLGVGGLPVSVPQVGIPAVPRPPVQFIPPAPAPLLPPQAPIGALQGQGAMAGAPPRYPEVPVIPETDSLALVLGGLAAVGAVALYRRRRT
jgi:hypothetical protein